MLPRPSDRAPAYQPRRAGPEHDPLYRVIRDHLEDFLARAEERGRPIPAYVEREFREYLRCGIPEFGFTWLKCEACDASLILPHSCQCRGFCPSCGGRRMNQLAANLVDRVLPAVPIRHWVLSFPMNVRFLLAWRPALRNEVMAAVIDVITGWYESCAARRGHPKGQGGAVAVWQMAGSAMNLNPHIHAALIDGVYCWDDALERPVFHRAQRPTKRIMERLVREVRARVEAILDEHGLLEHVDLDEEDGQLALQMVSVQGGGAGRVRGAPEAPPRERGGLWGWDDYYDLHAGLPIREEDRQGLERLIRYIARPPLSLKRLTEMDDGRLCLRLKRAWEDGTTCFVFRPAQLLGRLAAIVTQPKVHLTHYFGVLAPHAKWRPWVVPGGEPGAAKTAEGLVGAKRRSSWIPWAQLIEHVFGINPLKCGFCGGMMHVRAVVETIETARKLLEEVLGYPYRASLLESIGTQPARASPNPWW